MKMTLPMKPLSESPELTELLRKSKDWWDNASIGEKAAMKRAQRKSWVIGEMMLEHPEMTRERAEEIYDSLGL